MRVFIIAFFLLLLYLPKVSSNPLIQVVPIFALIGCIIYYNFKSRITISDYGNFGKITFFLILIVLIGLFRINKPDVTLFVVLGKATQFILFVFSIMSLLLYYAKQKRYLPKDFIFLSTVVPFTIYCLINLSSWVLGIKSDSFNELEIGKAMILSNLGIIVDRVRFPFVHGINSFGTVVGGIFTLCLVDYFVLKRRTLFRTISIAILILILLLIDSRSAILYPVIICSLCAFISKRKQINFVKILPYSVVIGPFLLVGFMFLLAKTGAGDYLARTSEDFASGNARFYMWAICLNEFSHFNVQNIFGYGDYGHFASGASAKWADIFAYHWGDESEWSHPHNTAIINLFDYGYIGLGLFLIYIRTVTNNIRFIWNFDRYNAILLVSFLIYTITIGFSEAFFGFYYLNSIYLFFSVLSVSFFYRLSPAFTLNVRKTEKGTEIFNHQN